MRRENVFIGDRFRLFFLFLSSFNEEIEKDFGNVAILKIWRS